MPHSLELTRDLAFAIGRDTASRLARKAGRQHWTWEEADIAAYVTNRLLYRIEPPEFQTSMAECGQACGVCSQFPDLTAYCEHCDGPRASL